MYTRLRMDKDNNIVKDEDGDFIKNEPQVGFSLFSIKVFLSIMCHLFFFCVTTVYASHFNCKKTNMLY